MVMPNCVVHGVDSMNCTPECVTVIAAPVAAPADNTTAPGDIAPEATEPATPDDPIEAIVVMADSETAARDIALHAQHHGDAARGYLMTPFVSAGGATTCTLVYRAPATIARDIAEYASQVHSAIVHRV